MTKSHAISYAAACLQCITSIKDKLDNTHLEDLNGDAMTLVHHINTDINALFTYLDKIDALYKQYNLA